MRFKYSAWVHPRQGGDDYEVELEVLADTEEEADKEVEAWLKRRSRKHNDYRVLSAQVSD